VALEFEWDAAKSRANRRKHGVEFEEAMTVFEDPSSLEIADPDHSVVEARYVLLGRSRSGRLLTVIHTDRGATIRLIGARPASWRERLT
jgi:uncharacterized DUF497 family protein